MCSVRSRMVLYPGFLDQARCEHIIKMAKARLRPSSLALRKSDTADKIRCAPASCLSFRQTFGEVPCFAVHMTCPRGLRTAVLG